MLVNTSRTRVALITGGGTGIGRATAEKLAHQGYHAVILGRREQPLRETAEAIGASATWYPLDVSQRDQVAATVALVVERWGQIDVLVNAAGFAMGVRAGMPLEEAANNWGETLATNLTGAFLMAIALAPHLTRPGGRIISISSIAAYTGGQRGGSIDYAAAKAGLIGMTHGLARDLSREGITANVIVPGFIARTEFTGGWSDERIQSIVAETPVGRPGSAEDIAAAVAYLASPEASFVTGEVLHVNGGWRFGS
jgi:NAD(P)-dependent dehydrogenase (short-subunit alcohol dehydrogenase family)